MPGLHHPPKVRETFGLYRNIHMIRADIQTAVSPIVGNEKQSEDMLNYLLQEFEGDTGKIWQSNIFGRSFHYQSAVPFVGTNMPRISVSSSSSSAFLICTPPAYPVRLPLLPTTRWQGMMMEMGL